MSFLGRDSSSRSDRWELDNVATRSYIGFVKAVGIRELKNRLSEYLRLVRDGEVVLVTDRGSVVAELRPPGEAAAATSNPVVQSLVRRGNVTIGAPNRPDIYPSLSAIAPAGSAEKLLDEERGEI